MTIIGVPSYSTLLKCTDVLILNPKDNQVSSIALFVNKVVVGMTVNIGT